MEASSIVDDGIGRVLYLLHKESNKHKKRSFKRA